MGEIEKDSRVFKEKDHHSFVQKEGIIGDEHTLYRLPLDCMMTTLISTAIYEPLIICQVIFCVKSYFVSSPLNNPRKEGNIIPQNLATGV